MASNCYKSNVLMVYLLSKDVFMKITILGYENASYTIFLINVSKSITFFTNE